MSLALRVQASWLRRGLCARLLWPVSLLYGTVASFRKGLYRFGLKRSVKLPVPVLVVGNLVAGGAGKTPTTMAVTELLRARGHVPGIVSRGYGRQSNEVMLVTPDSPASQVGDEPLLIRLRTNAPVAVGADRVAAALALLKAHPSVTMLISDDGLQHHRLARDAQIIVFDERGAGNGWLLPAGPLREPVPAQAPARSVVVYNALALTTPLQGHVATRKLAGLITLRDWWAGQPARQEAFDLLRGRRVLAAAGLARPGRFFDMLRSAGMSIEELTLPDHHDFATLPWPANTGDVIVTEKDAVKLRPDSMGTTRVWVAPLDFELSSAFASDLMQWLPCPTEP